MTDPDPHAAAVAAVLAELAALPVPPLPPSLATWRLPTPDRACCAPMSDVDPYARTVRQAAHDAVRAVLAAPPDSPEGSVALREVVAWLAREHGPGAVLDLAEELAVDLAEALDAIAAAEQRAPLEVADRWFHDQPAPSAAQPADESGPGAAG